MGFRFLFLNRIPRLVLLWLHRILFPWMQRWSQHWVSATACREMHSHSSLKELYCRDYCLSFTYYYFVCFKSYEEITDDYIPSWLVPKDNASLYTCINKCRVLLILFQVTSKSYPHNMGTIAASHLKDIIQNIQDHRTVDIVYKSHTKHRAYHKSN